MSALRPPANFDALARIYEPMERITFGGALARRRSCFLGHPSLASARRVLVLGDGDGRFTADLLARHPGLDVTAVDVSGAMLSRLEKRVRLRVPSAALTLRCVDVRSWSPSATETYDLVASHFFFDCLSSADVEALAMRIVPALAPGARWLVSEFAIPRQPVRALAARILVGILYAAFRLLTGLEVTRLPDHAALLTAAGLSLDVEQTGLGGALRAEMWRKTGDSRT